MLQVYVSLKRNSIATAPAFDPEKPLTGDVEIALHNHYWELPPRVESSRRSNESLSSVVSLFEALEERTTDLTKGKNCTTIGKGQHFC